MGNNLEKEAKNVNKMGDKKFKEKKYVDAIMLYEESIQLMREAGNEKQAVKFQKELNSAVFKHAEEINEQGDELFKKKEYRNAMVVYKNALILLKKAGSKWQNKFGKEFLNELNKCKVKYVKEELQEPAEELIKEEKWAEAAQRFREIMMLTSLYERWGEEINEMGDKLYKEEKFEEAIEAYTKSINLIKKSGNKKKLKDFQKELSKAFTEHALEINSLGDRLLKDKNFKEASDLYAQSVSLAKSAGDKTLLSKFTNEMKKAFEKLSQQINSEGDQLFKDKKFEEAAKIYKKSLDIAKEHRQIKLISNFKKEYEKAIEKWATEVNNLGDAELKAKNWEAAIKYYKKSVEIILKIGNKDQIKEYTKEFKKACLLLAKEINLEGDNLYKAGQYEEAYEVYDKSVKLAKMAKDEKLVRKYAKERNKSLEKMNY
ncbi:MAG: hypothetical protein ACFFD2_08970 [Promethearchaeota archaeon]